jgi:glycosyltransferase involved in cell wall biosynthesis
MPIVQKSESEKQGCGVAVLVPAYQPGTSLVSFVAELSAKGRPAVIVVDDGSGPSWCPVFDAIAVMPSAHILRHLTNLGKGSALKTGLRHIWTDLPQVRWVVTADADGQHAADDVLRVAAAVRSSECFVLGSRAFEGKVPGRSRLGNTLTRCLFRLLSGHNLRDTQSGLRGFPRERIPELLSLSGEHYEYEMNVLMHMCRSGASPLEIPLRTVYVEGNRSSHFRPITDSLRVCSMLLKHGRKALPNRLAVFIRR